MEMKPGFKQTEVGIIPEDWEVRPVGSVGEVRAGKALAARGPGERRPYLRTKNVFDGRIDIEDILEMPMTDAEFALYRLRHGDVLLNEGQSIELVGRCAMYQDELAQPCAIQNQLVRFRAFSDTSAGYATHLFRRCQATGVFAKIAMQTTSVAHLGVSRFAKLRLAWPPTREEQEAIAGVLSDADALINSLEQRIAKKRQIKQGALQELMSGQKRLPEFGDQWESVTVGDIAAFSSGFGISVTALGARSSNAPVPVYGGNGIAGFTTCPVVYEPTVVIGRVGQKCGEVYLTDGPAWITDNALYPQRFRRKVHVGFLALALRAAGINNAKNRNDLPLITQAILHAVEIPLPRNTAEQQAVSEVLSDIDAEVTALEVRLAKAQQLKLGMMQELLTGRIRLV